MVAIHGARENRAPPPSDVTDDGHSFYAVAIHGARENRAPPGPAPPRKPHAITLRSTAPGRTGRRGAFDGATALKEMVAIHGARENRAPPYGDLLAELDHRVAIHGARENRAPLPTQPTACERFRVVAIHGARENRAPLLVADPDGGLLSIVAIHGARENRAPPGR